MYQEGGIPIDTLVYKIENSGPFLTYIYASSTMFNSYSSGILNNSCCYTGNGASGSLNHSVITVGWGITGGQSYWIIRNSWGTGWGENGYGRITMTNTGSGICGN